MDKKELNDLIDRVVLTGPGGVDRIKKILKEIANGSESGGSGSGCQCLAPMIVEGSVDESGNFTPVSGAPAWSEARAHMLTGGLIYFLDEYGVVLANVLDLVAGQIGAVVGSTSIVWGNQDLPPIIEPS